MIYKDDRWIQIGEFDDMGEIRFTKELLDLTAEFPGVRKFVSQLITHWGPEYTRMLDYFGPEDSETDKYTGLDTDPLDVVEDVCDVWEYKNLTQTELGAEFYRDIMRSKIVSLRIPEKLIKEYMISYSKFLKDK